VNGCDRFTQEHYRGKYGIEFPLSSLNFDDEVRQVGNVNRLKPKPPKKDYFKWVDNQMQLRFDAAMVTQKPEDVGRKFIITLFLNDDTVMVYEPQVRNSGIVSGKFLEKTKYKNKLEAGRFFEPQDFLIGKLVEVNSYRFRVQEHDERTKKWFEEHLGTAYADPQPQQPNPHLTETQAWERFQDQQPVADGRGWDAAPAQGSGDYLADYYGDAGRQAQTQNPTRR